MDIFLQLLFERYGNCDSHFKTIVSFYYSMSCIFMHAPLLKHTIQVVRLCTTMGWSWYIIIMLIFCLGHMRIVFLRPAYILHKFETKIIWYLNLQFIRGKELSNYFTVLLHTYIPFFFLFRILEKYFFYEIMRQFTGSTKSFSWCIMR